MSKVSVSHFSSKTVLRACSDRQLKEECHRRGLTPLTPPKTVLTAVSNSRLQNIVTPATVAMVVQMVGVALVAKTLVKYSSSTTLSGSFSEYFSGQTVQSLGPERTAKLIHTLGAMMALSAAAGSIRGDHWTMVTAICVMAAVAALW